MCYAYKIYEEDRSYITYFYPERRRRLGAGEGGVERKTKWRKLNSTSII